MERLTERTNGGMLVKEDRGEDAWKTLYQCYGAEPTPRYENCDEGYCAMETLAEYEDTGITPGQIREIDRLYAEKCKELAECRKNQLAGKELAIIAAGLKKLREYEALEEQGKLLKLPCAVGSLVYEPYQFMGEGAWEIDVHKIRLEDLDKIGKTVFLTREEAEAALKELEDKNA